MSRWFFAGACLLLLFWQGLGLSLCIFSYLGRHGQFFELTTHFQPFYFAFALLLLCLSLCLCLSLKPARKRLSYAVLLSALPVITLLGSGYRLYPSFLSAQQKAVAGSEKITLLHCNLWGGRNRDRLSFLSLVQKEKPDLVAVCEVEQKWHGLLSTSLKQAYPYCITFPHVGGVELYSRYPLDGEVRLSERGHRPRIFAHVHVGR
ncbi:MAG: endonuclease/exonuclease/phosphatase family protein [Candidatus Obscuribacter sp.]|nr:endonuclease/exonuclease/phosphatase family protein [Candidatus Obscuribacter sp.]